MTHPRAFISFDFDNNKTEKILFAGQAKNSRTPFNIQDWSSKDHLPQNQWEVLIEDKVSRCDLLIVLVGRKTYAAKGVLKEIGFAKNNNVPVFGVYVDDAGASITLPAGLLYGRTINWDWDEIAHWVNRCVKERKSNIEK